MRNGKASTATPPAGSGLTVRWVARHMDSMPVGGVWVLARSVSTVLVLSKDPPITSVRTVFPDPSLIESLRHAGWTVQHTQVGCNT